KSHLPSILYHTSNPTSTLWPRNSAHNTRYNFYKNHRQHPRKSRHTNELRRITLPRVSQIPIKHAHWSNYIYFLTLLALVAVACAQDNDKDEQKLAQEIGEIICDTEDHPAAFYSCIECCQGMHPFLAWAEPNAVARKKMTGVAEFGPVTQKAMCDRMTDYAEILRNAMLDEKDVLNDKYATEEGMVDFFNQKVKCFRSCKDSPEKKEFCIPFVASTNPRPPPPPPPPAFKWDFWKAITGGYDVPRRSNSFRTDGPQGANTH
ncbi:hypothetical protein BGZ89_006108, partial [Linnemannia elongata]